MLFQYSQEKEGNSEKRPNQINVLILNIKLKALINSALPAG